jgi:hypothetical protein
LALQRIPLVDLQFLNSFEDTSVRRQRKHVQDEGLPEESELEGGHYSERVPCQDLDPNRLAN